MDRTLKSKRFLCQEHHVKRYGRHLQAVDAAKGQFKCKADSPCDPPSCPDCRAVVPGASAICVSCGKLVRELPPDCRTVIVSHLPVRFRVRHCKHLEGYMEKWGPVRRIVPKKPNRAAVVFKTPEAAQKAVMAKHETKDGTMWATMLKKGSSADTPLAPASQRRRVAKEEAVLRQQTAAEKLLARRKEQKKRARQRRRQAATAAGNAKAAPPKPSKDSNKDPPPTTTPAKGKDKSAERPKKSAQKKKAKAAS